MGLPHDWTTSLIADGLMCYPPEGPRAGGIRVLERRRPMERFRVIADRAAKLFEGTARDITIGAREELTTAEGEYAALVTMSGIGRVDGVPIETAVAVIYGDDFYDRLDGYTTGAERMGQLLPALREFTHEHKLGLGTDRQRAYKYDPPKGWTGIAHGLFTEWIHPDYPRHFSRINVAAAMPEDEIPASEIAVSLLYRKNSRFHKAGRPVEESITSTFGLSGITYHIRGTFVEPDQPETEMFGCVLRDERYVHLMRLETVQKHLDEDRLVLLEMVKSIQPIPRRLSKQSDVFVHWSE